MYSAARVTIAGAAFLASLASASFDGNLNYDSPSRRHVNLGIDVPKVAKRAWKRDAVAYAAEELNFTHGVASGDPWPDSVILWTRVAPGLDSDRSNVTVEGTVDLYNHETEKYIQASANPICVEWKVYQSSDVQNGTDVVSQGKAYTTSDIDYTVKVKLFPIMPAAN
jgi:alkaline phosphatase D